MRYVKWTFLALVGLIVIGFLHYTLPQRDIVRINKTEVRRVDFGVNSIFYSSSGSGDAVNTVGRDVFFIEAFRPNGNPIVYRNEDTGWGWPPYFKFDTSDLQARAGDLVSTGAAPKWVVVRHYGWRSKFLSIYPNALSVKPVDGPDVTLIPWFNIVFFTLLAALALWLRRVWLRFRRRRIDPVVDEMEADWDEAEDRVGGFFDRLIGRRK